MTLSRRLVGALTGCAAGRFPARSPSAARLHLLDAVGVGLAAARPRARRELSRRRARAAGAARPRCSARTATGACRGRRRADQRRPDPRLEYDDTHTGSIVHGSSVACRRRARRRASPGASGRRRARRLRARLGDFRAARPRGARAPSSARDFRSPRSAARWWRRWSRPTSAGLDEDDGASTAVGIALSQSSGVFEFLTNGSSVKSLHPGWAAHAGVLAARFAQAGHDRARDGARRATAACSVASPARRSAASRFAELIDDLGTRWHLPDARVQASIPAATTCTRSSRARSRCASAGSRPTTSPS